MSSSCSTLSYASSSTRNEPEYYLVMEKDVDPLGLSPTMPPLLFSLINWTKKTKTRNDAASRSSEGDNQDWTRIFSIDQDFGVNLEDKKFETEVGMYKLQYKGQGQGERFRVENVHALFYRNHNQSHQRICVVSSTISVFIKLGGREQEDKAVFVISLCNCQFCRTLYGVEPGRRRNKHKIEFDVMAMKPVDITMKLTHNEEEQYMESNFYPGVTDQFDMAKEDEAGNFTSVVYYSFVPLSSLTVRPFKDFDKRIDAAKSRGCSLTTSGVVNYFKMSSIMMNIEITQIDPVLEGVSAGDSKEQCAFKTIFEDHGNSDFLVISSDGKEFPCNRAALAARSPVFKSMLSERKFIEGKEGQVKLSEDASATEALIRSIYFQKTNIGSLNFKACIGTLKLAHMYEIMELVASVSKILLSKLKSLDWEDVEDVMDLYEWVRHVNELQIVVRLKMTVIMTLRRLILEKKNKRVREDEEEVAKRLAISLNNNPNLGAAMILDIFQLLNPKVN